MENIEVVEDESSLEENIAERQADMAIVMESMRNNIAHLTTLSSVYHDYKNNRISEDRVKYAVFAAESALNLAANSTDRVTVFATEGLLDRIGKALANLAHQIHIGFQKYADYVHFTHTWFTMQRGNLNKIQRDSSQMMSNRVNVRIGVNKWMQYGEHESTVRDMKEYMEQFKLFHKTMVPFLEAIAGIAEDDLFSSLQWYKEALVGEPEDFVKDRFQSMERYLSHGAQGMGAHVTKNTPVFVEHRTPYLLGISSCFVRMPAKRSYNIKEYESIYNAHHYFYMGVDRLAKVKLGTMFSGSIELEVGKNDVKELVSLIGDVMNAADLVNKISIKFSNLGSLFDSDIFSKRDAIERAGRMDFYESVKVYARICSLIYDSVSASYNFSFGNIKQGIKLCSKAIDKAK